MTRNEGKRLKIGDRVDIWRGTPHECSGTVTETGYSAVKFTWDDGQIGIIHLDDLTNVARIATKKKAGDPGPAMLAALFSPLTGGRK